MCKVNKSTFGYSRKYTSHDPTFLDGYRYYFFVELHITPVKNVHLNISYCLCRGTSWSRIYKVPVLSLVYLIACMTYQMLTFV